MAEIRKRDSRFELLRVLSIFIIVLHHLVLHTAIDNYTGVSISRLVSQLYLIGGKLGVNCFVFITGYFGIYSKFHFQKVIKIELQVLFYTVLFLAITAIFKSNAITLNSILVSLLPTTFGAYWYITAFMGLLLLSPFINIVLKNITGKQYVFLLIICLFMFSIAPTFLRQRNWTNDLGWFVVLYIIGGGIHQYEKQVKKIKLYGWILCATISLLVTWSVSIIFLFASLRWNRLESYINVFSLSNYSTFVLLTAFCIFMCFVCMKPFEDRKINVIASYTLGIYLIQSNPFVSSLFLWPWIENFGWHKLAVWPIIALMIVWLICGVCIILDVSRSKFINRVFLDRLCKWIDRIWE